MRSCDRMNANAQPQITVSGEGTTSTWNAKMAELEAIHKEIAPKVEAKRLEEADADALNDDFELAALIAGR